MKRRSEIKIASTQTEFRLKLLIRKKKEASFEVSFFLDSHKKTVANTFYFKLGFIFISITSFLDLKTTIRERLDKITATPNPIKTMNIGK